ncbi:hypothetical protein [Fibrobacter sp. UWB12]|jgi:hypothetical protein|uniref:hypothetical protein n=1 Tax=Fibrobacter sp. UWB12 TaxID=1896203 RepID=UPI00092484CD|nr:hypothetical protein [Fibrobacter sp. UWB12]SHK26808.1 hypothetical protein SAMN05720759_101429 [Fibrobacter sp. UWB12]
MRSLANRYKFFKPQKDVFSFEKKANTVCKLTAVNGDDRFLFVEKGTICQRVDGVESQVPFTDSVIVSVKLDGDNIALLGYECCSSELQPKSSGVNAADILYIFFPVDKEKKACFIYDMKHTFGHEKKDVLRFYNQCISTMKYAASLCYLTDESDCIDSVFSNIEPHFGVVTTGFSKERLDGLIKSLDVVPEVPQNAQERKYAAQNRQNEREMSILRSFLDAQVPFNNSVYPLDIRIAERQPYEMHFVNGILL